MCLSVDCHTGQSSCCNKFSYGTNVHPYDVYADKHISHCSTFDSHMYFFSHLCPQLCRYLSETKCLNFVCANVAYTYITVTLKWNIYVQYGNHIHSLMYVKCVYSATCHMLDYNDLTCGT